MKSKIIGVGGYVPPEVVTNAQLCDVLGHEVVTPAWIEAHTLIRERRWANFQMPTGRKHPLAVSDTDLAEIAARRALDQAALTPAEVDGLSVVTCTPDEVHFSYPATELHRRLGLSGQTLAHHIDSGCAGLAYAVDTADSHLQAGKRRTILVVASNLPSAYVDRERYLAHDQAWFPMVVFGDGASALVLQATAEEDPSGILALYCGADGTDKLMSYPVGGSKAPPDIANVQDHRYEMDARMVKRLFVPLLERSLAGLQRQCSFDMTDIARLYLHQANGLLLQAFAQHCGLPKEKVPMNLHHYGNTSAVSTLLLLAEDHHAGQVQPGDLVLFLWVGAGAHYGGMVLRL